MQMSNDSRVCQDGRAVQGAAFRSQSGLPGVGSNPTSDKLFLMFHVDVKSRFKFVHNFYFAHRTI